MHDPLEQESPTPVQLLQAPPPLPHSVVDGVAHWDPEQQLLGHEAALQVQLPKTHACPVAHAAPDPQPHFPVAEQVSAPRPQSTQAAPPAPHALALPTWHLPAESMQPEQAPHWPLLQLEEAEQIWQAAPPVPQFEGLSPGRQLPLASQQPVHPVHVGPLSAPFPPATQRPWLQ